MKVTLKFALLFFFIANCVTYAQIGDGPESHFLKPQKMWSLNFKYLNLNQNVSINSDFF